MLRLALTKFNNNVVSRILALFNMSDKRLFAELLDRLERTDALGHTTERLESMSSSVRLLKTQAYADAAKVLTQEFVVYELNYQRQVLLSVVPVPRWPPKFPRLWPPHTPPPELIGDRG